MVDQYSENQYDDDLTVGADEYEDYDPADAVDLFEFSDQEESPTSRLKSLILSIDWEITDEVLMQFNEELVYLEGFWRGEKINLVYVQALQKISKYIYQQKANSHPNAIKLLLKFYYNLEKIVSSEDLTSEQKKDILLEDVKRFEGLKRQIARQLQEHVPDESEEDGQGLVDPQVNENALLNLKATILGIDWEITEEDLNDLRQEVVRLEEKYAESRPKLILLQGIGTLGTYIKVHKTNAHGDAFKLLHLFFESLERIVKTPMSPEEEKAVLFPVIEKFNSFKTLLGPTASPGATQDIEEEDEEDVALTGEDVVETVDTGELQPALADFQEGENRGFQDEEEAEELGSDGVIDVSSHIDQFFGKSDDEDVGFQAGEEEVEIQDADKVELDDAGSEAAELEDSPPASMDDFIDDEPEGSGLTFPVDKELALQGVEVETEDDDDSDEEALPVEGSGILAPALGDTDEASIYSADSLSSSPVEGSVDDPDDEPESSGLTFPVDKELALQGVEVETEDDDDSEEDALPVEGSGILAPALGDTDEASIYSADSLSSSPAEESVDDPEDEPESSGLTFPVDKELALQGVEVETEDDDDSDEEALPIEGSGILAPALGDTDEASIYSADSLSSSPAEGSVDEKIIEKLDDFFIDEVADGEPALDPEYDLEAEVDEMPLAVEDELQFTDEDVFEDEEPGLEPALEPEYQLEAEDVDEAPLEELEGEARLADEDAVFEDEEPALEPEYSLDTEVDDPSLADEGEKQLIDEVEKIANEVDRNLDAFFGLDQGVEEAGNDSEVDGLAADDEEEVVFELVTSFAEEEAGSPDVSPDSIQAVGQYIDSIGSGFNEKIIRRLGSEIDQLQQQWSTKSLEISFLQLLSTITQHIERCRADSDPGAYELLKSNYDALSLLEEGTLDQNQEVLHREMSKVLKWQQDLLFKQITLK